MKKFFNKFLLVVMAFILVISVVGCDKNKGGEKKPAKEESLPTITDPILPAGDVNVAPVLDLLSPVLGNAYTTIKLDADLDAKADSERIKMSIDGAINLKMTGVGYDVVANASIEYEISGSEAMAQSMDLKLWFVDGTAVIGMGTAGMMQYAKVTIGNFNDLVSQVNEMVYYDEEYREIYQTLMPILEELNSAIEEAEIENKGIDETFDLKAMYEQIMENVLESQSMDVYSWALINVFGVNPYDTIEREAFESAILEFGEGNPTVAEVLDRLVATINTYLPEDQQITLKALFDEMQASSGYTTSEIINIINYELIEDESQFLPVPEGTETLYDYAYSILHTIKLNDLIYNVSGCDSLEELYYDCVDMIKQYTVGDVFNEMMDSMFMYGEYEYVYTPGYGEYDYDVYDDYYYYVGEGGDYSYERIPVNYIEEIENLDIAFDNFTVKVKYTPDSKGRPTLLSYAVNSDVALTVEGMRHNVSEDLSIKVTFSYTKPSTSFSIPSDVLSQAQDMGAM